MNPPYSLSRRAAARFSFELLADNFVRIGTVHSCNHFRFEPAINTYVAVDSPDESARCGQGSMIGRAFAAGRPAAPLPRRGTDAGAAPLDRDEYDGSKLAHSGLPVTAYSLSRCSKVIHCGSTAVMASPRPTRYALHTQAFSPCRGSDPGSASKPRRRREPSRVEPRVASARCHVSLCLTVRA